MVAAPGIKPSGIASFPIALHLSWLTIGLSLPFSAKYQPDKSEHHQDGSGYHQPMRILHR
jgi:hypothetical protein